MPKLNGVHFETAIIERCRRRECCIEEALIEMYLAGDFVHRGVFLKRSLGGEIQNVSILAAIGVYSDGCHEICAEKALELFCIRDIL